MNGPRVFFRIRKSCAISSQFSRAPRSLRRHTTSSNGTSSVNHAEISHFSALASSWWDSHGPSRLLHLMNPLRHQFIRQCLSSDGRLPSEESSASSPQRKIRYLDIGCGGGIFAESAARLATTEAVLAIDPTPEVIAVARQHQRTDPLLLQPGRLRYENLAIEQLPAPAAPGAGFDVVSLFEVVEHIEAPAAFLRSCLTHLRPGGWLIGSTIARTHLSWLTTKLLAEDVLRLVPRGTHDWSQYLQPNELREWARSQDDLDVAVGSDGWQALGVVYVPGWGWQHVAGSEEWGNYFFGIRKAGVAG